MIGATTPRDGEDEPAVMRVTSLAPAWEVLSRLAGRAAGGHGASTQDAGGAAAPAPAGPAAPVDSAAPAGSGGARAVRDALLVTGAIGAVVGAGFAAWQRRERTPTIDPWVAATAPDLGLLSRSQDDDRPEEQPEE